VRVAGDEAISKRQKGLPPRHCEKPQSHVHGWRRSNLQTTKRSPSPSLREAAKPCARLATKQSPNDKKVSLPVIAGSRKAMSAAGDEAISKRQKGLPPRHCEKPQSHARGWRRSNLLIQSPPIISPTLHYTTSHLPLATLTLVTYLSTAQYPPTPSAVSPRLS